MYIPSHFQIEDEKTTYSIIHEHSFATLFSQHDGIPFATHLPLLLDQGNQFLYGHFSRGNPQWKDIQHQMVLAVFHGPHCYISPSWYVSNASVPTWNYVTVHVYGEAKLIEDEKELVDCLKEMVLKYEDPESLYQWQEIDADYLAKMYKGIQGFKIKISKIEGKAKLSQNQAVARQELVIKQLEQIQNGDEQKISSLMKANLKK